MNQAVVLVDREESGATVHVVAALGLSVLTGAELDGTPLPREHDELARTLDDDAARATIADWVVRTRPATPSSELTPLAAISSRYPAGSQLVLHILMERGDELHLHVVDVLRQVVERLPDLRAFVEIVAAPVTSSFTTLQGAVGAGAAVPNALAELVPNGADVWVNATSSVRSLSIQAVALAGVAGWRVFIIPDQSTPEIHVLDLRAIGPDRAAVMAVLDDDDVRSVLDELLPEREDRPARRDDAEVRPQPPLPRLGPALRTYYETLAFSLPDRPAHAATAAVLSQFSATGSAGSSEAAQLADGLAACVRRWVDQRLWSLNLIPEIVVHDDRHVERVDGFTAMLIAPLLHSGTIPPVEAAAVSAAAWLHDWGHVGSRLGDGYVSHPIAVRYLHGLLSQQLIADAPTMHGLEQLGRGSADLVGVLCAHHQRWCSCSAEPVAPSRQRSVLELFTSTPDVLAPSLQSDAQRLGIDPERLELLVSILRVADAADIGAHRVPDYGTSRLEFLTNCARRELSRTEAHLHQLEIDGTIRRELVDWVHAIAGSPSGGVDAGDYVDPPDVPDASGPIQGTMRLVKEYLRVLAERGHDDLHRNVRLVRFRIGLDEFGGVTVQPTVSVDPGSSADLMDPVRGVANSLTNELDCMTSTGTVRDTLRAAGIHIADAATG